MSQIWLKPFDYNRVGTTDLEGVMPIHLFLQAAHYAARDPRFILKTLDVDRMTQDSLLAIPVSPYNIFQGISLLWFLTKYDQWDIIDTLISKGITITPEMLIAAPIQDNNINQGKSVLWLMANRTQWERIQGWLDNNLITEEMLLAAPKSSLDEFHGVSVLDFMGEYQQWDLFQILISQELFTSEMLSVPLLGMMAKNEQWDLIQGCINRGLITQEMLCAVPTHSEHQNQGETVLWMMAKSKQ